MMFLGPRKARVVGSGICLPRRVLTNFDLERMVDTSDQWIRERSGISTRHVVSDDEFAYTLAAEAAKRALEDASVSPVDLDGIVVATNSPDTLFPATACRVQAAIGASRCGCLDVQSGCTGSVYAIAMGAAMISSGIWRNCLVVGVEALSRLVNWKDRNTCVLFGDGAGALVLTGEGGRGGEVVSSLLEGDGECADLIELPAGMSMLPASHRTVDEGLHYVRMKGNEVFKFVVRVIPEFLGRFVEGSGYRPEEIDWWILHQANYRIMEATMKRFSIPMERAIVNIDRYGNTSAASVFIALHEALKDGRIAEGHKVVICSFGAGMTWGAVLVRW